MSYLNGYADREFIEELPRFRLPMAAGGVYRAFEVGDDAMQPSVPRNTTIVARYVEEWHTVKGGTPCIVVSKDGVIYRRLYPLTDGFCLRPDCPEHQISTVAFTDIIEVWEAKAFISSTFPLVAPSLESLASMVVDLTQQVAKMQQR